MVLPIDSLLLPLNQVIRTTPGLAIIVIATAVACIAVFALVRWPWGRCWSFRGSVATALIVSVGWNWLYLYKVGIKVRNLNPKLLSE